MSEPIENSYTVTWILQVDAYSARDAAQFAREIQLDPTNIAGCFHVQNDDTGEEVEVDVLEC